jgi:hypothetical protein
MANPTATAAITEYLTSAGAILKRATPHGEYLRFVASVSLWEQILPGAEFYYYEYVGTSKEAVGQRIVRTHQYALPTPLAGEYVHYVAFATHLPAISPNSGPVASTAKYRGQNGVSLGLDLLDATTCNPRNWTTSCPPLNFTVPAVIKRY